MTGGSQEQPLLAAESRQALSPDLNHHHQLAQLSNHLTRKTQLVEGEPMANNMNSFIDRDQLDDNCNNRKTHTQVISKNYIRQSEETSNRNEDQQQKYEDDNKEEGNQDEEEEIELLSEALLGVASAEEYAAKIVRIQQACLHPLKEDLADWLNKIMNVSTITSTNFMDKLDNGVVICKLAKLISNWCKQQIKNHQQQHQLLDISNTLPQQRLPASITGSQLNLPNLSSNYPLAINGIRPSAKLSTSSINVHSSLNGSTGELSDSKEYNCLHNYHNRKHVKSSVISTSPKQSRFGKLISNKAPSKSSSQSTYCLMSSSQSIASQSDYFRTDHFLSNFTRMDQTKIWEEAKPRTFYARDNVCNFIKWSKDFGVNQSVLFESDDLVLHANTRQVVLCLLDVARIACVKHGFVEAPGLVKFEQEIGREKAAAAIEATNSSQNGHNCNELVNIDAQNQNNSSLTLTSMRLSNLPQNTIGNATDDLIMRYCIHKEEEASRKRAEAELESIKISEQVKPELAPKPEVESVVVEERLTDNVPEVVDNNDDDDLNNSENNNDTKTSEDMNFLLSDSLNQEALGDANTMMMQETNLRKDSSIVESHVDSLDSGEGRTESASTSHSRTPPRVGNKKRHNVSSIPVPIKRSNSNMSLTSNHTSSIAASEMSSSRSSLLSGQDANSSQSGNNNKHHITSDLDGKVMHIAKSYYGKAATKGITRLSEGKYKIADRIVFVRLLKGHRVMVRIGGGWDTLENFLFRHKSDPSQVIDVDNLLPLESKMTPDKSSQILLTPTHNNKSQSSSKLPYYKRSSSVSSTNLSTCNLFFPGLSR